MSKEGGRRRGCEGGGGRVGGGGEGGIEGSVRREGEDGRGEGEGGREVGEDGKEETGGVRRI